MPNSFDVVKPSSVSTNSFLPKDSFDSAGLTTPDREHEGGSLCGYEETGQADGFDIPVF